jgi:hypothetical protein
MVYPRDVPTIAGGVNTIHHLYFDTMDDYNELPTLQTVSRGSDAYCVATQDVYILNGDGVWEVQ